MSVSGVAENCARATSANRNDARKAKAICGFMLRRCAPPSIRMRICGRNSSIAPYPGLGVSPRLLSVALGLPGLGGTHVVRFPEARFRPFRSKASAIAWDPGAVYLSAVRAHEAEWLRSGLQNRLPRFNSGRGLQSPFPYHSGPCCRGAAAIPRRMLRRPTERSAMTDFYPLVLAALAKLDRNTEEARQALYQRARTALTGRLRKLDPPP